MSTTLALMHAEFVLLRRDTTAWTTAIVLPLGLGALWALNAPPIGDGMGSVIVLQVMLLLTFTLHTVGTMALASRREQLVLKRWRSSQAGAVSVLAGSIGVPAVLVLPQAAVLTWLTMQVGDQRPASVAMLLLGLLAGVVSIAAITFVAAAFTRSAEHAMITTVPVIGLLLIGAGWALRRPFDALDWPILAIPGGATTQLLRLGWDGPTDDGVMAWVSQAAPSLAASALITAIAVGAAVRYFRWDPRF